MKKYALYVFCLLLTLLLIPTNINAATWPLGGMPDVITSDYGPRNVSSGSTFHYGLDLRANSAPVRSITATTISAIVLSGGNTGNYVQTADGFRFLHLSGKTSDYEIRTSLDGVIILLD